MERKTSLTILIMMGVCVLLFFCFSAYGLSTNPDVATVAEEALVAVPDVVTKGFDKKIAAQCPRTLTQQFENSAVSCLICHSNDWSLRELEPGHNKAWPRNVRVFSDTAYLQLYDAISSNALEQLGNLSNYLQWHKEIKHIDIDILSPGGSLMIGWQMIGQIESIKSQGIKVTTRANGFAASAAFLLFCGGDERIVYEHALLLHHELWTFKMYQLDDPSSAEENSRVMRLMQDNIHHYLIKRGMITKEQLDTYVRGEKDYWMTGAEAFKAGFATSVVRSFVNVGNGGKLD